MVSKDDHVVDCCVGQKIENMSMLVMRLSDVGMNGVGR